MSRDNLETDLQLQWHSVDGRYCISRDPDFALQHNCNLIANRRIINPPTLCNGSELCNILSTSSMEDFLIPEQDTAFQGNFDIRRRGNEIE